MEITVYKIIVFIVLFFIIFAPPIHNFFPIFKFLIFAPPIHNYFRPIFKSKRKINDNMKHQCDLCKYSKPSTPMWFIVVCLLIFPIGIPVLAWISYTKIFKISVWCYNENINWIKINYNKKENCDYYNPI